MENENSSIIIKNNKFAILIIENLDNISNEKVIEKWEKNFSFFSSFFSKIFIVSQKILEKNEEKKENFSSFSYEKINLGDIIVNSIYFYKNDIKKFSRKETIDFIFTNLDEIDNKKYFLLLNINDIINDTFNEKLANELISTNNDCYLLNINGIYLVRIFKYIIMELYNFDTILDELDIKDINTNKYSFIDSLELIKQENIPEILKNINNNFYSNIIVNLLEFTLFTKNEEYLEYFLINHASNIDFSYRLFNIIENKRCEGKNREVFEYSDFILNNKLHINIVNLWRVFYELSIVCFYIEKKDLGMECSDKIILSKNIPYSTKENVNKNQYYYCEKLGYHKDIELKDVSSVDFLKDSKQELGKYHYLNPSILKLREPIYIMNKPSQHSMTTKEYSELKSLKVIEYIMNLRTVNYHCDSTGNYFFDDESGDINTRNIYCELDKDLNIINNYKVVMGVEDVVFYPRYPGIKGMEDCRVFEHNSKIYFTFTSAEINPRLVPQICLGRYNDFVVGDTIKTNKYLHLRKGDDLGRCEKNWLPFSHDDKIKCIYSYHPFIIIEINENTGIVTEILRKEYKLDFSRFRGSAGPIPFVINVDENGGIESGYLLVIHEVCYNESHWRNYFHRFVYLDYSFEIKKISYPFYFYIKAIEFCSGIVCCGNDIILTVGISDSKAVMLYCDVNYVKSILHDI